MANGQPLSPDEAHQRIRRLVNEGSTILAYHASDRMNERNVDDQDVMHVLTYGSINGDETHWKKDAWRYVVTGEDIEGEETKCVVVIEDDLIIVTVI